ncbi:DNA-binding domain-containing protein [Pseudomonas shirazica]|uniref:DNA-binding domain-containing protein n=1 Tax=Pseudomonas shirazica TaxID=1940636 RepID=UPI00111B6A62|nr:DNA-binding domain-containing protein [Pseudomonas shirazica]
MELSEPRVGAQYRLDALIYEVVSICDDTIALCSLVHSYRRYIDHTTFAAMEDRGTLCLHQRAITDCSREARMRSLPEEEVTYVRWKARLLEKCLAKFGGKLPEIETKKHLRTLAEQPSPYRIPSYSTLAAWKKTYLANSSDPYCLLPPRRPRRPKQFPAETEKLLNDYIDTVYLTLERPTIQHTYKLLKGEMSHNNRGRLYSGASQLTIPSYATFRRRINALDRYLVVSRRFGRKAAERLNKSGGHLYIANELGAVTHFDTTPLDIIVVDSEGKVLGRPTLSVHIDLATRMIVGWDIGQGAPCAEKMIRATLMAIINYGKMSAICSDHGKECFNKWAQSSCELLGITLDYVPVGHSDAKAFIERFFRTANMGIIHNLPGTTKGSPRERGDYPSEQRACLTIEHVREIFSTWLEIYHDTFHDGILTTPRKKYESMKSILPPPQRYEDTELKNLFLSTWRLRMHRGRVQYRRLIWSGKGLPEVAQRLTRGQKAIIHYNPCDLGQVWVSHPDTPLDWHPAEALNSDYQNGLTLSEHLVLLKHLNMQKLKFDNDSACERLYQLSARIQEMKDENKNQKSKSSDVRQATINLDTHSNPQKTDTTLISSAPLPEYQTYTVPEEHVENGRNFKK